MKFTCEKGLLQTACTIASRATASKSPIPALEGLLIEARADVKITGNTITTDEVVRREIRQMDGTWLSNEAISTFDGASKRLELVKKSDTCAVYKDFAHAPSKLRATIHAMHEQYPDRKLIACMELHTFSSLTQEFLQQYHGTMDEADIRYVYFSQHALQLKKLPPLDPEEVRKAFGGNVEVFTDSKKLVECVIALMRNSVSTNLLMMSSGNFDGIDFAALADEIL